MGCSVIDDTNGPNNGNYSFMWWGGQAYGIPPTPPSQLPKVPMTTCSDPAQKKNGKTHLVGNEAQTHQSSSLSTGFHFRNQKRT